MDSEPKHRFNDQAIKPSSRPDDLYKSNNSISVQKEIASLIKEGNVNRLKQILDSVDKTSFDINELDKDIKQTILYQAVQFPDKAICFSMASLLVENGVINF